VVLNRSRCNTRPNSGPEDDSYVGGTEKGIRYGPAENYSCQWANSLATLVCERDKASDAMFIPRFISEIPLNKPLDVVRPENSTTMLCLYHSAHQIPQRRQMKRKDGKKMVE
jgi:hypothetical protein